MDTETIRKGLSKEEARILSQLASEGKMVLRLNDIYEKTGSIITARKMASALSKRGWLERLDKGVYLINSLEAGPKPVWTQDSYYIASKLVEPYYIGYYNMLNFYGWTEQVPLVVNIATTKKLKAKTILGVRYNFIQLSPAKFFGAVESRRSGYAIMVSDKEKTLIDGLDHPEYCGGIMEVAKALYNAKEDVDWEKTIQYAKKMGNGAVFKRFGYLAEAMGILLPQNIMQELATNLTEGYAQLSPEIKSSGTYNSRWKICENVKLTKESVLA